jgi:hypothetical protein
MRTTRRSSPVPVFQHRNVTRADAARATVEDWRSQVRPLILRKAAAATKSLAWSPALIELLLDELHVDESLAELLGSPLKRLSRKQYAQAIALALLLRHSWRPDDLLTIVQRLGLGINYP